LPFLPLLMTFLMLNLGYLDILDSKHWHARNLK
jgi:hypothetical protein